MKIKDLPDSLLLIIMNFLEIATAIGPFGRLLPAHRLMRDAVHVVRTPADAESLLAFPRVRFDVRAIRAAAATLAALDPDRVVGVESNDESYPPMRNLERLNAFSLNLRALPDYGALRSLNCAFTRLSFLPEGLDRLEVLDVSYTLVASLPPSYTRLVHLAASHTLLRAIPESLANLEYLDVSYTLVRAVSPLWTRMQNLFCSYSCVSRLPDTYLLLRDLDCSCTLIRRLPESYTNLEHLDCGDTLVTEIPESYASLRKLGFYHTSVSSIPPLGRLEAVNANRSLLASVPRELARLAVLHCAYTPLQTIPKELDVIVFSDIDVAAV